MLISRLRSPSTRYSRSMHSRRRLISCSVRSRTLVAGFTPVFSNISRLKVGPMPKIYVSAISMRLSRGRSTPAILANCSSLQSALALLVLRVRANHPKNTLAPNDFAFFAHSSHRRSNLHYLYLHMMRPRVRSYGESSTFTRSPGRMRT
jgi:hypothetical protein